MSDTFNTQTDKQTDHRLRRNIQGKLAKRHETTNNIKIKYFFFFLFFKRNAYKNQQLAASSTIAIKFFRPPELYKTKLMTVCTLAGGVINKQNCVIRGKENTFEILYTPLLHSQKVKAWTGVYRKIINGQFFHTKLNSRRKSIPIDVVLPLWLPSFPLKKDLKKLLFAGL